MEVKWYGLFELQISDKFYSVSSPLLISLLPFVALFLLFGAGWRKVIPENNFYIFIKTFKKVVKRFPDNTLIESSFH